MDDFVGNLAVTGVVLLGYCLRERMVYVKGWCLGSGCREYLGVVGGIVAVGG